MASPLLSAPAPARDSSSDSWRQGLAAGASCGVLGLLASALLTLSAWASAPHTDAGATDALRMSGSIWLLMHGVPLPVGGGVFAVVPLGFTALSGFFLIITASRAVAAAGERVRPALLAAAAAALGYALVVTTAAALLREDAGSLLRAALGGVLVGVAGAAVGALRSAPVRAAVRRRLAPLPGDVVRGALAAALSIVAAGGLLAGAAVAGSAAEVTAAQRALDPGVVGGLLLFLLQAAYVPVAALWGAAILAGPGIALGQGAAVSFQGSTVETVPAVPLLAALPSGGSWPVLAGLFVLVPVAAGALGMTLTRVRPEARAAVTAACGVALGAGVLLGLACLPAAGSLSAGHYAGVGPSPLLVALAVCVEVAVGALAVVGWRRRRT